MKKIFWITISLLVTAGVYIWLISPKINTLKDLNLNIELKKTEIQTQTDYFNNLQSISKELSSFPDEVAKINSALPENFAIYSLVDFLQKTSSSNGLTLKSVDFANPSKFKENSNINFLNISLGVSGSYSAFKNFLTDLEKSSRIINVEKISFSTQNQKEKNKYDFEVELKVYSY